MKSLSRLALPSFFLLPALLGVVSIAQSLLIPADPKNASFLGFSTSRLLLLGLLLMGTLLVAALAGFAWMDPARTRSRVEQALKNRAVLLGIGLAGLLLLTVSYSLLALPERYLQGYAATLERARPLLTWLALVSLQTVLGLLVWTGVQNAAEKSDPAVPYKRILCVGIIVLSVLVALWLFIGVTRTGVWPGNGFWGKAGVPILWPQVALAFIVGLAVQFALIDKFNLSRQKLWLDIGLCVLIWLAAVLLWSNQSYLPGVFNTPPHPPNFQIYPASDSQNYDLAAESQLLGAQTNLALTIDKPVYILFLALLHLLAGSNYSNLYLLQVAVFAFIPVLGYLLGQELHGRQLGTMFGVLLILKEQNAIALTNIIQVSTSKMILSEPLTTLGILFFTLLLARWLKKPHLADARLWIAGGILGLTGLVRLNALTIFPLVILLVGLALKFNPKKWLLSAMFFTVFLVISIVPWSFESFSLTHNPLAFIEAKTGGVILDNRYAPLVTGQTPNPAATPGKGAAATTTAPRTATPAAASGGTQASTGSAAGKSASPKLENYLVLGENITQHYLHNLISMLVMLPPTGGLYSLTDMAVHLPYWTQHWDGTLQSDSYLILIMVLCFVSLGIGTAWTHSPAAGLAPLLVILGYDISAALSLTSGGRYMVPIDWGVLLYFSMGGVEITSWIRRSPG